MGAPPEHLEVRIESRGPCACLTSIITCDHYACPLIRFALQPKTLALVIFNQFPMLLWVSVVSVGTTAYYELYQTQGEGRFELVSKDYVQPFLLTSLYLSLLLVHRVSSSYERWYVGTCSSESRIAPHTGVVAYNLLGGVPGNIGDRCIMT